MEFQRRPLIVLFLNFRVLQYLRNDLSVVRLATESDLFT